MAHVFVLDWAWIKKSTNQCNYCPSLTREIQGAQGEDNYSAHSCFLYKHYSHFNDDHALQAPHKIAK